MGGASEASAAITRAFPCIASASNPYKAELLVSQSGGLFGRCQTFRDFFCQLRLPIVIGRLRTGGCL
jgi:hypothetical protein